MLDLTYKKENTILLAPRFQSEEKKIRDLILTTSLEDHFIILSSGTTSIQLKGYALSRTALIANAHAVNDHYQITKNDIWMLSLPGYHVGGLSVLVRAALAGNEVIRFENWNPEEWVKSVNAHRITLSTIVPTQLYDLVKSDLTPPSTLRALIVGGDFLSDSLEAMALDKGWPVFRTFGMTEVCSQLASSRIQGSKDLDILPIHQVKTIEDRLWVKSSALFTLQFELKEIPVIQWAREFCDEDNYFRTQDRAEIKDGMLKPLGRLDDQIKISGRLYSLLSLKNILEKKSLELGCFQKVELFFENDERKGKKVILSALETVTNVSEIADSLLPLKPDEIRIVKSFARTDLGKLKKL